MNLARAVDDFSTAGDYEGFSASFTIGVNQWSDGFADFPPVFLPIGGIQDGFICSGVGFGFSVMGLLSFADALVVV